MPLRNELPHPMDFNRLVIDLIEKPDRDLAVLGCSLLDLALEESIIATLEPHDDTKLRRVINSLNDKIDMARAIGVIDAPTGSECAKLAKVRNEFAHSIYDLNCDSDRILPTIGSLADPSKTDVYDWKRSLPPDALIVPMPGVLKHKDGEVWADDLAVVIDRQNRVLLYVRTLDQPPSSNREKLLYCLWNCINAACGRSLLKWRDEFHKG